MSRHRFVKNMDLDGEWLASFEGDHKLMSPAEMADDDSEDESGMTAEQKGRSTILSSVRET